MKNKSLIPKELHLALMGFTYGAFGVGVNSSNFGSRREVEAVLRERNPFLALHYDGERRGRHYGTVLEYRFAGFLDARTFDHHENFDMIEGRAAPLSDRILAFVEGMSNRQEFETDVRRVVDSKLGRVQHQAAP